MKNKGLSVLLSFVLVLVLAVSFSVPVNAATGTVVDIGTGYQNKTISGQAYYDWSESIITQAPVTDNSNQIFREVNYLADGFIAEMEDICFFPWSTANTENIVLSEDYDYARVNVNFKVTPSLTDYVSNGLVSSSLYIKSVYVTYYGEQYFCDIQRNSDGSYNCTLSMLLDLTVPYSLFDNNMTLHIVSSLTGTVLGQDNGSGSNCYAVIGHSYQIRFGTSAYFGRITYYDDTGKLSDVDIENQTDTLTGGFDSSSMSSSNTALSGSISEFTGAESQITDQSFGFIDQVQFYDLNMQPQLLACITFCSSWLQSLFVNIGDWGILVMVSLSLGFGLMLVGWFKYRRK